MFNSFNRIRLLKKITPEQVWNFGIILLVISTTITLLSKTIADPDLWGHLRFGLDILETREISQVDPYSYLTGGQRWINHEWLSEVFFALAWQAGKSVGLLLLNVGIVLMTLGIAFIHLTSQRIRTVRTAILLILTVILLRPFISTIRPQMFTYLGFAIIMSVIYKAEYGNYGWLWIAPPLIAVWINLHGGFLAGLGILFVWGVLHLFFQRGAWKMIVLPLLFSATATLINPYGIDLLKFLLRTVTVARPEITDWQPLQLNSLLGIVYLLLLTISILGLVFSPKKRSFVMIIVFGILAILPIMAIRHLQLFSIGVIMISGEHIWHAWDRFRSKGERTQQISAWVAG